MKIDTVVLIVGLAIGATCLCSKTAIAEESVYDRCTATAKMVELFAQARDEKVLSAAQIAKELDAQPNVVSDPKARAWIDHGLTFVFNNPQITPKQFHNWAFRRCVDMKGQID